MKDTRIDTLVEKVSDYYDCNLKEKKRDTSHIEARGLFIVLARREFSVSCSALSVLLKMSKSNIVRTHSLFLDHIKNNKHIRRRFEEIQRSIK